MWTYFILTFVITWLFWLPGLLATWGWFELPVPFVAFFFVGTWGPFVGASWCTYREKGWAGLKQFWKSGFDVRFSWRWYLAIFVLVLLVSALPLGVHLLLGGPPPASTLLEQPWMILAVLVTYFCTGGANEEWGWRGYALDRLQVRWGPLVASIVLGLIWGLWHLPLFFIEYTGQYHESLLIFMIAAPFLSILHTWFYNGTGKKLLAAWLFHAAIGAAWETFPIVQPQVPGYERVFAYDMVTVIIAAVLVLAIVGPGLGQQPSQGAS